LRFIAKFPIEWAKARQTPSELGLLPDGMPSMEQVKNFLEFAKEIEEKIQKELNKDE